MTPVTYFVLTSEENEWLTHMFFRNVSTSRAGGLRVHRMGRLNRNELLWVGSEIKVWSHWGIASKAAKLLERFFGSQRVKNCYTKVFLKVYHQAFTSHSHLWSIKSYPCAGWGYLAPSGKVHLLKLSLNLVQHYKEERCATGKAQWEPHTGNQGLQG